jgi:hypothetical protein
MTNSIRIILTFDTWQLLEETLLEVLPKPSNIPIEVIVLSPTANQGQPVINAGNLSNQKVRRPEYKSTPERLTPSAVKATG